MKLNESFFEDYFRRLGSTKSSDTYARSITSDLQIERVSRRGDRAEMEDADVSYLLEKECSVDELKDAMICSIKQADNNLKQRGINSGACVQSLALTKDGQVVSANIGDTQAIAYVYDSVTKKVTPHLLNKMHRPNDPEEMKRVRDSGGRLTIRLVFKIIDKSKIPSDLYNKLFDYMADKLYTPENARAVNEIIEKANKLNAENGLVLTAKMDLRIIAGRAALNFSRAISNNSNLISSEATVQVTDLKQLVRNKGDKIFLTLACDGFFEVDQLLTAENYALLVEMAINRGLDSRIVELFHMFASSTFETDKASIHSNDNLTLLGGFVDFEKLGKVDGAYIYNLADGHNGSEAAKLFVQMQPMFMMEALHSGISLFFDLLHVAQNVSRVIATSFAYIAADYTGTALCLTTSPDGGAMVNTLDVVIKQMIQESLNRMTPQAIAL